MSYLLKSNDEAKLNKFLKTHAFKRYSAHSDSTNKATYEFLERVQALNGGLVTESNDDEEVQ